MESLTDIQSMLDQTFAGISLLQFATVFLVLFFSLLLKRVIAHLFTKVIFKAAQKTSGTLDDMLVMSMNKPVEFLILILGIYISVEVLQLPTEPTDIDKIARNFVSVLLTFNISWFCFNAVGLLERWLAHWAGRTESTLDDQLVPFIRKSLRIFIVIMALLMLVQNLGYSISGLLASLGLGGLAVALAAKDSLSNIFGSLMILFDRPFLIGDWIKAGDMEGTVDEIGFRSTRIRTFAKTQITVPNSVLMNMSIDNYSRMPKRRIKLTVGLTYATKPAQMRSAVDSIKQMLREHPAIDQEFFLVNFTDFGSSSLDIMVYCFTTSTIWTEYLAAREDICLKIMDLLEQQGLEIAFPSQTLYLQQDAAEASKYPSKKD
ncbi:MscS family membrane protein [Malonomonas rubra DSM 5091]|uniref:MscS family membrane protein n=1 Tax=Malonomonas rubra DSM 5091 TaxID=1122189 RepID=A0A1M6GPU5_MALRU|nr:mechanosensitive ion channel family protein [Malonomonas rubra]SHJ11971.1 MscS family membrane protein [Malonomonas rubra DSM 5091]